MNDNSQPQPPYPPAQGVSRSSRRGSSSLLALSFSLMLVPMRLVVYAAFPRCFDLYLGTPPPGAVS